MRVVGHRDVCSRASIYERFDGVVRGTTVIPPGYADAGVIAPIPGATLGVALAVAGNPRYGKIDAQRTAELAVIEAAANVAAVGAAPAGMTDCLNFGDPTDPRHLGDFVAAVDGLAYAARELGTPFVSGNVSLYNQSKSGRAVAPSPIVACVGTIADISKTATMAFKRPGSTLFFVNARPRPTFGGSVFAEIIGLESNALPVPDFAAIRASFALLRAAYDADLIHAAHDVSDGGLLAALAEMTFPTLDVQPIGVDLVDPDGWLAAGSGGRETAFFSECGGFVVEASDAAAFERLAQREGARSCPAIGTTTERAELRIAGGTASGSPTIIALGPLREAWAAPLRDFYGAVN